MTAESRDAAFLRRMESTMRRASCVLLLCMATLQVARVQGESFVCFTAALHREWRLSHRFVESKTAFLGKWKSSKIDVEETRQNPARGTTTFEVVEIVGA